MLNKLNIFNTIIICIIIGIIATIYAYFNEHTIIKYQEQRLNNFEKIQLYIIRMIHYSISFYARIYPLITKISLFYDVFFIIFFIIMCIQWTIFSECILSIKEKKLLDPNYINGSDVKYEPFFMLLYDSKIFYDIMQYLGYFAVLIVTIRILYTIIPKYIKNKG